MIELKNKFPNVSPILPPKGQIPAGYRSMARSWSFPKERLGETVMIDGEPMKKMLTLDINIPGDDFAGLVNQFPAGSPEANRAFTENYGCSSDCSGCFNQANLQNEVLRMTEVFNILDQARPMGLESTKFLGPGELFEKKEVWDVLEYHKRHNLILGVFTKAGVLGSDYLAQKYHGISSREMVERVLAYPNLNFYLEGRSFDPVWENRFIPLRDEEDKKHVNYYETLCVAYERLAEAGLNADLFSQRMTVQCNPVTHQNIGGVLEILQWAMNRNMPCYLPPTMQSGKGHLIENAAIQQLYQERFMRLAVQVYIWVIERGVMSLEQLCEEGVHPYLGTAPCNQISHGLYIHVDGRVWRCPGRDTPDYEVSPDVRATPLVDIWRQSQNYRVNAFNNHCPAKDGGTVPKEFYVTVLRKVKAHFGK